MTVYGLADSELAGTELGEVFDLFIDRGQALEALHDILRDEPDWQGRIRLVEVELGTPAGHSSVIP